MADEKILVVDDDPKIRSLLSRCLTGEGFTVLEAENGPQALDLAKCARPDLITLDINLGHGDGFEVAREVRTFSDVPIIMITGKDDVIDRVVGLELGADDYITKPFHLRELIARVKSVLRRGRIRRADLLVQQAEEPGTDQHIIPDSDVFRFDDLTAIPDQFKLLDRDDKPCELTSGDFKLLNVFLLRPKRILSREQLMDLIGGPDWTPLDRTIDNQVARLRKKIERDPAHPKLITTVRGVGYSFTSEVVRSKQTGSQPEKV
ncbi:response regulator transcription factor [Aliiroseovarius sp. S1339]|uniref:response regulator n=1 Tax=Aliiroseovarius sp. S1339 TaxID=2936990 RepID=UPI0020BEE3FB|nr:response regulator transcription factor [Aliiroseovarius sp. S1339]MCK8462447.1 response regulator transcription factor [Aliiroseovarius sp. S1339]